MEKEKTDDNLCKWTLSSAHWNNVPQLWGLFHQQDNAPYRTAGTDGVDEGPPDQDPVMASQISRPELHWKPLKCDQEEDGSINAVIGNSTKCLKHHYCVYFDDELESKATGLSVSSWRRFTSHPRSFFSSDWLARKPRKLYLCGVVNCIVDTT